MKKLIYAKYYKETNQNQMEYLPIERSMIRADFIKAVQRIAEEWKTDIEIFACDDQTEVHFYFNFSRFSGVLKSELQQLIEQCTAVKIPARKTRACKTEIILIWQ
jgi:hypothetical protein